MARDHAFIDGAASTKTAAAARDTNGRGAARRRRATSVTKQDARRGGVDGGLAVGGHRITENGTGPDRRLVYREVRKKIVTPRSRINVTLLFH